MENVRNWGQHQKKMQKDVSKDTHDHISKKMKKPSDDIEKYESGHRLGKYEIIGILGQGGNGIVYLAKDMVLGKQWAIKQICKEYVQDLKGSVLKEAAIMKELDHFGIPRITEQMEDDVYVYLVMDYCKGKSLLQYCQTEEVAVEHVISWGIQLCDILEYLHKQEPPVIFRDMKPANIICDKSHHLKLIDFGIAMTECAKYDARGTKGFAAPEQYRGEYSVQSDIYNLSATLWWCLGDIRAYGLRRILKKGMHDVRSKRYQSVSVLHRKLLHMQKKCRNGKHIKAVLLVILLFGISLGAAGLWMKLSVNKKKVQETTAIKKEMVSDSLNDELEKLMHIYVERMEYKKQILQQMLDLYKKENYE